MGWEERVDFYLYIFNSKHTAPYLVLEDAPPRPPLPGDVVAPPPRPPLPSQQQQQQNEPEIFKTKDKGAILVSFI